MASRVLALILSVVFLLSGVFTAGAAIADVLPQAAVAAVEAAPDTQPTPGGLPAGDSGSLDQAGSVLDLPDQLEGPRAPPGIALQAYRPDSQVTANLTHPHLAGPQRPPRAASLPA